MLSDLMHSLSGGPFGKNRSSKMVSFDRECSRCFFSVDDFTLEEIRNSSLVLFPAFTALSIDRLSINTIHKMGERGFLYMSVSAPVNSCTKRDNRAVRLRSDVLCRTVTIKTPSIFCLCNTHYHRVKIVVFRGYELHPGAFVHLACTCRDIH